jgi:mRNA interferase HigB
VNVISKRGLLALGRRHPETLTALDTFYRTARKAQWKGLHEVRGDFASADQVGRLLIFNILGGNYRLLAMVDYPTGRLFIKALLTHGQYDRKEWMKWA